MSAKDGGPAFPAIHPWVESKYVDSGMSLRDWFAGMALQGLFASGHFTNGGSDFSGSWMTVHEDPYYEETGDESHPGRRRFDFPQAAWRCADAMLAAREKTEPEEKQ